MHTLIDKAASPVRLFAIGLVLLAGLSLGYFAFRPITHGGPESADAPAVAGRFARTNGWEIRPDPWRPSGVVFLVDPERCRQWISVSALQITAPDDWEGIVRIETVLSAAGEVDPAGGFVWRGLWFFGDRRMLERMLPDLR
jgi:hypothetical protein